MTKKKAAGKRVVTENFAVVDMSGKEVHYDCGHSHPGRFAYDLYGTKLTPNKKGFADHTLCANCRLAEFKKVTIRCALCGGLIMPGEAVALYVHDEKIFDKPERITFVETGKIRQVIGCMDWDCCWSAAAFAGHWTGDHFESAFEGGGTMIGEVMRTGKPVVGHT